ncbi:MAG: HypC/HybG/HupF family hydrogenase formation chaperone [Candidatus Orphnella occulta]|nr:HypC/HybG/HupF family hydrogenase formation chaperone [Candidatus Orphnella occulta]MDP8298119.1 HypC/HybG/HupF family hydrogenase formation chaperone [Candidatus Orphnella occulta]
MCWSVPGKILEIKENIATVEISGLKKDVGLDIIDDPKVGEYVVVHAGYAIQKVDEESANFTIDFFNGKHNNA